MHDDRERARDAGIRRPGDNPSVVDEEHPSGRDQCAAAHDDMAVDEPEVG
jgi:hypothetical protein